MIEERDIVAAMLWQDMYRMTDQEVRDVVKLYPEYFELKEDIVSFDWDAWLEATKDYL